jgi:hypothetical protein
MISFVRSMAAGTAVKVVIRPIEGAARWRLLRRADDAFAGPDDEDALLVYDGVETGIIDVQALANGQVYYYRAYYLVGDAWTPSATVSCTPAATFLDVSVDAKLTLRERLDDGLRALLGRGAIVHPKGHIPVLTAPPSIDDVVFPVVTLHLTSDAPQERGLGDVPNHDTREVNVEKWTEHEGWLSRVQVAVIGWSLNSDERDLLRKAIRAVVLANLPVFDFLGMQLVEFSQQDAEDMENFNAPMHQSIGTFSCTVPAIVDSTLDVLHDVQSRLIQP